MSKQVAAIIDMSEELDALRKMFGRFAFKSKELTADAKYNVDMLIGKDEFEGNARFIFYTRDLFKIDIKVDCAELIKNPKEYLDNTMEALVSLHNEALAGRQKATRIELN